MLFRNFLHLYILFRNLLRTILKRVRFNLGLSISAEIGIVAVLVMVVTIPMFTHAVMTDILQQQLRLKAEKNKRSLFSLHAYYNDQSNFTPVTIDGMNTVSDYIRREIEDRMGLEVERIITETNTRQLLWKPVKTRSSKPGVYPYQNLYLRLLYTSQLPEGAEFVEGTIPSWELYESGQTNENTDPILMGNEPIPVAVLEDLADKNFINVGDILRSNVNGVAVSIEVTGIFRVGPHKSGQAIDEGWFYSPDTTFNSSVWVPVEFFESVLPELIDRPQNSTTWYAIVDNESLRFNQSRQYSREMIRLETGLSNLAPDMRIDYSPLDMLLAYEQRLQAVTILLTAAGAPMILLAILFISLTSSIAAQQNTNEIVTMRTRGINLRQGLIMNVLETMLLILFALPLVAVMAWFGTLLIGQSQSFLQFGGNLFQFGNSGPEIPPLGQPLSLEGFNLIGANILPWFAIMVLVIIMARAAPLLRFWRITIFELKQSMTRQGGDLGGRHAAGRLNTQPLWQRYYLDIMLFIPSLYVYLTQRGFLQPVRELAGLRVDSTMMSPVLIRPEVSAQFLGAQSLGFSYDPLEILAASFFAIACCMLSLRILPPILRSLRTKPFGGIRRISRPWSYMAMQEITQRPQDHNNTLLLIMIALSLSFYTASMARTLSLWIIQSRSYQSGADLVIREYELDTSSGTGAVPFSTGEGSGSNETTPENTATSPFGAKALINQERHLEVPGIQNLANVGSYSCKYSHLMGDRDCTILGVDRLTFPQVAFFRTDFASGLPGGSPEDASLGALMNALAIQPSGVLVPRSFLEQSGLTTGDTIRIKAVDRSLGLDFDQDLTIAGSYLYFPTVYPEGTLTFIMNLETLFGSYDAIVGNDVWLDLQPGEDSNEVIQQVQELARKDNMAVRVLGNSMAAIEEAKSETEWTGLFGVLNLGFLLTGLMPGIGFILYSFASLHRRTIEFGILQAIGLSIRQLVNSLVFEQVGLMSMAIVVGILVGYLTSLLFLPILQASIVPGEPVPPFQLQIGWSEAGWLGMYFFVVLSLTIILTITHLVRMKIFQAVKMGESIS